MNKIVSMEMVRLNRRKEASETENGGKKQRPYGIHEKFIYYRVFIGLYHIINIDLKKAIFKDRVLYSVKIFTYIAVWV